MHTPRYSGGKEGVYMPLLHIKPSARKRCRNGRYTHPFRAAACVLSWYAPTAVNVCVSPRLANNGLVISGDTRMHIMHGRKYSCPVPISKAY